MQMAGSPQTEFPETARLLPVATIAKIADSDLKQFLIPLSVVVSF
jgi:hypothetical protein